MIKVLVADDHRVLAESLQTMLRQEEDIDCIGVVHNGTEVLRFLHSHKTDVVLMDINMPELDGIETTKIITKKFSDVKVLGLTMLDQASIVESMMKAGASGYVIKNSDKKILLMAIRTVHKGEQFLDPETTAVLINKMTNQQIVRPTYIPKLTRREIEVLHLIAKGDSTLEIAKQLFISHHTAESHRKNLRGKIGARNSAELVRMAMERGILTLLLGTLLGL